LKIHCLFIGGGKDRRKERTLKLETIKLGGWKGGKEKMGRGWASTIQPYHTRISGGESKGHKAQKARGKKETPILVKITIGEHGRPD